MIIDQDGNISIITQEKVTIIELVKKLEALYPKFEKHNIIIKLTALEGIKTEYITEFLRLSNKHHKAKNSFVIVANNINIDDVPEEMTIVPTVQEAYDIIEMEDMERDLGF